MSPFVMVAFLEPYERYACCADHDSSMNDQTHPVVCQEMEVARTGKGIEEEGGAVFDVTKFQLDYLTTPSGFLDIGIDYGKTDITTRTRETDELYIIAYPHFNVNGMCSMTRPRSMFDA